jgi:excisionase family DNA binding protein
MEKLIVTTPNELESIIQDTISKAFSDYGIKNTLHDQDRIISIEEACTFLNLAKQTLYGFTSKNEIPFIKRGKKLYFRKSDLEKWLLEGKRKTKAEILLATEISPKHKRVSK